MTDTINAMVTELKRDDTVIRYASTSRQTALGAAIPLLLTGEKGKWTVSVYPAVLTQEQFNEYRENFGEKTMENILAADAQGFLAEVNTSGE